MGVENGCNVDGLAEEVAEEAAFGDVAEGGGVAGGALGDEGTVEA